MPTDLKAVGFKAREFVVCNTDNGFAIKEGIREKFISHFASSSVGCVRMVGEHSSRIYVIGEKTDYMLANEHLMTIDPTKTGKGYEKKICNICHCLKEQSDFAINQTDSKGNQTSRPSCKICRRNIDQKPMTNATKKAAEKVRPENGTLWECPICRKESIVGVTAKIILDHRHSDGTSRAFLCDSCNTGLGRFKNGHNYLKNAIAYLENFEK